jgi:hypothetical protein
VDSLRTIIFAGLSVLVGASHALAFVNPNFTPIHVERQSALICTLRLAEIGADGGSATFAVAEVIKGDQSAKQVRLDLAAVPPDERREVIALVREHGAQPALLMAAAREDDDSLLHVAGAWVRLARGRAAGTWRALRIDTAVNSAAALNATFNGSTDMLTETMRFIVSLPDLPIMAVDGGVRWEEQRRLGKVGGRARGLAAVDVNGDGRLDLYAACPAGDAMWFNAKDQFQPCMGLKSASLAGAWADFDGDGRPDLASLSAQGLTLHLQTAPGTFTPTRIEEATSVPATASVHVIDLNADGQPDLVVAESGGPTVFRNVGRMQFERVPLSHDLDQVKGWGQPGPCVVADFDNDGFADIVQCYQGNALLYCGKAGGFAPGVACGAAMGAARTRSACVADFDSDGRLDLLLVGGGRTPLWYRNRIGDPGGRSFEDVTRATGEPSYVIQAGAAFAAAGDFNNDTFVDLFFGYTDEPAQVFYNRGFRSYAICEALRLSAEDLEGPDAGQAAALWADLDGNGSEDLVVALDNGDVYLLETNVGGLSGPVCLRAAPAPAPKMGSDPDEKTSRGQTPFSAATDDVRYAGPITVQFDHGGRCFGARVTGRWRPAAQLGVSRPGEYGLRWTLSGAREVRRTVVVETKSVDVRLGAAAATQATDTHERAPK